MMKTCLYIRQDWLDKLKLKAPVTIDDFYNVAKAFALNDPDGNGKKDTYGYGGQNEWTTCTYFFFPIQNAFTKFTSDKHYDEELDKLVNVVFDDPGYKEYLKFLQRSYKEKILEPQIFTNKEADLENLFLTGKTGILDFYCINADEIYQKTKAIDPNAKITIINPPVGPAGSGNYAFFSNVSWSLIRSTKNSPEGIFKYVCDAFASPEGQQLLCYGPEGINWKMVNGVPTATVPNPTMGLNPTLVINQDKFKAIIPFSTELTTALKAFDSSIKIDNTNTLPVNPKEEQLNTLFQEYYAKIITGVLDVDAGMAEWQKKLKEKGLDQYYIDVNKDTSWAK
jgi:ABC-type glycerol-3-phosphate transport system substrate-binding protein